MGVAFTLLAEAWPAIASGVLCAAVALWLVVLNRRDAPTRAFAMMLLLVGILSAFSAVSVSANRGGDLQATLLLDAWNAVVDFAYLCWSVLFLARYLWPSSRVARARWTPWAVAAVVVALAAAALALPQLVETAHVNRDTGFVVVDSHGPIYLGRGAPQSLAIGLICALFVLRTPASGRAHERLLVSLGFALNGTFFAYRTITLLFGAAGALPDFTMPATDPFSLPSIWFTSPVGLLMLPVLVWALVRIARTRRLRRLAVTYLGLLAATVAFYATYLVLRMQALQPASNLAIAATGVAFLLTPLLVGYTLLRHGAFDIQVRLKWSISRGAVAAIFLGFFFVVAQLVQGFFSQSGTNWIVGGVAAGLLLLALHPIQRFAERLASAAVPGIQPVSALAASERDSIFLRQAQMAWADGQLSLKERSMLEDLRRQLGISPDEALKLEHKSAPPGSPKAPKPPKPLRRA
jgi:hypothetical protein